MKRCTAFNFWTEYENHVYIYQGVQDAVFLIAWLLCYTTLYPGHIIYWAQMPEFSKTSSKIPIGNMLWLGLEQEFVTLAL